MPSPPESSSEIPLASSSTSSPEQRRPVGRVVCIGGAVLDRKLHLLAPAVPGTSNPARSASASGGVARNVAENLLRLGLPVALVSRVGADDAGAALLAHLTGLGGDVTAVTVVAGASTAQYVAVLDPDGGLVIGVADMAVLDGIAPADVDAAWPAPSDVANPDAANPDLAGSDPPAGPSWVVADCNLPPRTLARVLERARGSAVPVAVDAVSTPKVVRLPADLTGVGVLFCNHDEARALLAAHAHDDTGDDAQLALRLHARGAGAVVLTRGADGVVLADRDGVRQVPAVPAAVVDVTGAGDALVAGTVAALAAGRCLPDAVALGTLVAARTVASERSVVPELLEPLELLAFPPQLAAARRAAASGPAPRRGEAPMTSLPAVAHPDPELLDVAPEVAQALAGGRAVVALESTIISHGMPYPDNLRTARAVEGVVRAAGAVPATVAVVGGRLRVGLDDAALERLAGDPDVAKASRRDLPALVARGATAGTTVAATMYLAHLAGIAVFATGGIGGVHRGAEHTFDISADLDELACTPVTVVCAGAKSILDLPKTLEVLETGGVPVVGVGTDEFPAFFTRTSGLPVDHRVDTAVELAALVAAHRRLGMRGGILVANPIPAADALDPADIDARIADAVADGAGVTRKEVTPYLLARINELTEGRSLVANIALIRNNARLAAELAVELAALA